MEFEDEMDFGEGTAMGEKAKDRLKNLLSAPSNATTYCKAIVTEDCEGKDSDFGEGARSISFRMEGTKTVFGGCTCTKEEYEAICKAHNVSETLVGITVKVKLANGIIVGIH